MRTRTGLGFAFPLFAIVLAGAFSVGGQPREGMARTTIEGFAAAASLPQVQVANKFDLVCSGPVTMVVMGVPHDVPSPEKYETTLRVDLDRGSFCESRCDQVESILLVQPDVIVFRNRTQTMMNDDRLIVTRTHGVFFHK